MPRRSRMENKADLVRQTADLPLVEAARIVEADVSSISKWRRLLGVNKVFRCHKCQTVILQGKCCRDCRPAPKRVIPLFAVNENRIEAMATRATLRLPVCCEGLPPLVEGLT